jgi:hypothetical protein
MNGWKPSLMAAPDCRVPDLRGDSGSQPASSCCARAASNYRAAATFWIEGDIEATTRAVTSSSRTNALVRGRAGREQSSA